MGERCRAHVCIGSCMNDGQTERRFVGFHPSWLTTRLPPPRPCLLGAMTELDIHVGDSGKAEYFLVGALFGARSRHECLGTRMCVAMPCHAFLISSNAQALVAPLITTVVEDTEPMRCGHAARTHLERAVSLAGS